MMFETGRVVALEPDGLWVETIRQSTCGTCAAQKGCGHSLLNKISDGKRGYVRVLSGKLDCRECEVDDEVRFSIPEEVILRGSLIVYMVPLLGMLLGAALGALYLPGSEDLSSLAGALAGVCLGLLAVRWHGRKHSQDPGLQPTLEEILTPASTARPVRLL